MDKGNVDKYGKRTVAGQRVPNAETWGRGTARERYRSLQYDTTPPPRPQDMSRPQDPQDRRGPSNDVSPNSWLRGGGKGGEGYKYFDRGKR